MDEREFRREHEAWVARHSCRVGNWQVFILQDSNPKVIVDHAAFSANQGARFSAMALDEMIRDGAIELCELVTPEGIEP